MAAGEPVLDVITIGRSSVDLYGQQVGGRLEDMASFSKAVGGCPTNIAIGAARLGLKSGLITRVGDEHMGRFIVAQCAREGVNVDGIKTDPQRLTSLVILGIRDDRTFPLIFYRDNCADDALCEADIAESYVASARAIVVTGTHFARPGTAAAQNRAIAIARKHKRQVIFDIDYRPNLWGLAGHGAGEARYIKSDDVTAHLQPILPDCDMIVGTEEELMIAGGGDDVLAALRAIRARSQATIVCKRGPMGCSVFDSAIPATLEAGIQGRGFPVEVYNVLGAGDAFMAGFLRGYLRNEPIATCCAYANACGAFAVSRLLCSVEYPTEAELQHFLAHGSPHRALRRDRDINHIHWTTTRASRHDLAKRQAEGGPLMALAIDHRAQFEAMADLAGAPRERIGPFKALALAAACQVRQAYPALPDSAFGLLIDAVYGRQALFRAAEHGLWIGRPVEEPGSRPLDFEGSGSLAAKLIEWPLIHTIKCLSFYHPDDPADLRARQDRELERVYDAARALGRELLIELIAGKNGSLEATTLARLIEHLYGRGIRPDWWKLEPQKSRAAWANIAAVIAAHDPACRGILMLGLDAPIGDLAEAFEHAAPCRAVRGFAIGRSIFARPAEAWLRQAIDDAEAVRQMATTFQQLVETWLAAKRRHGSEQ
jgi:5-dehydro-2-deoxygluconokinase